MKQISLDSVGDFEDEYFEPDDYFQALRYDLSGFIRKSFETLWPTQFYHHNWHIDMMADYLMACHDGDIKNLIINIQPRIGKSLCASIAYPAWVLGNNPGAKVFCASYGAMLANELSVNTNAVMKSKWYKMAFPETKITRGSDNKTYFKTTAGGCRFATSVTGPLAGFGGTCNIVDDPHNPKEVLSEVQREKAIEWFKTWRVRVDDPIYTPNIVIMQRLHEKDLTGHLMEEGGWTQVCIPTVAEKKEYVEFRNHTYQREEGELLHASRFTPEVLAPIMRMPYIWAGQYQQRPAPAGGGIFKEEWFQWYEAQPQFIRIIQSWDTAFKAKELSDPSACITIGETEHAFYILHVLNAKLEYPELKKTVIAHAAEWKPNTLLVEDKASGQSLIQELRRETKLPVFAINPQGDKVTRAAVAAAVFDSRKVFLPKHAGPWLDVFKNQLLLFPNSEKFDMVDALSQFFHWAASRPAGKKADYLNPRVEFVKV